MGMGHIFVVKFLIYSAFVLSIFVITHLFLHFSNMQRFARTHITMVRMNKSFYCVFPRCAKKYILPQNVFQVLNVGNTLNNSCYCNIESEAAVCMTK